MIVLAGRVTVTAENAGETIEAQLDAQSPALYAPPSTWLDLWDFSPDAVIMVLASAPYDESDYIREREDFDRLQATMRSATVSSHG